MFDLDAQWYCVIKGLKSNNVIKVVSKENYYECGNNDESKQLNDF